MHTYINSNFRANFCFFEKSTYLRGFSLYLFWKNLEGNRK
jgi:hypothetical protein